MPAMQTLLFLTAAALGANEPVDYARDIKPLLAARCYTCHGALKQKGGLRLDTAAAIRTGGEGGAAVSLGKPAESLLIERVTDPDGATRMPPEAEGSPLEPEKIALLRAWIEQGAIGPENEKPEVDPRDHWSFRAPVRPPAPQPKNAGWVRNPIDAFIAAGHDERELTPQPAADKRLWLRRVHLDLTGLPPTLAQLEAFAADESTDAYDKVVDRLLDSPQYGERWGRHWMDIWRYSDWWGLGAEVRNSQKHIWHWRDWIIESFNGDLGYDEMLRQMLAADELYPNDMSKLRASGFLARQYFRFNRNTWLDETVEHTSKAFLGLTLNCNKCHDHKYDPWSQQEYYKFRAFFEPYQVRMDQVPGEADYEKDGLPRVFDCHLEAPTYLFIRGDEKRPRTDQPLAPDVPALLRFADLNIEPVALPRESHQPGLRPWVLDNHLAAADRQIAAAREALEKARKSLVEAEAIAAKAPARPPTTTPAAPPADLLGDRPGTVVRDDFGSPRPEVWEQVAGEWKYEGGRLLQSRVSTDRAILKLKASPPADFEARFRFVITGGQTWKSLGIAFDLTETNEFLAYVSAGGSKVQLAYRQGKDYTYPADAVQTREVKLDTPHELLVRVRGPLVNVSVNGEHALAWRTAVPRQPGALALIAFDATAAFTGFELAALPAEAKLVDASAPAAGSPGTKPASVEELRASVALAEKTLALAELQPAVLRARAAADRAQAAEPAPANVSELIREAARAEKTIAAAKAAEDLARAEVELAKSDVAKKADVEKKVTAARDALAAAVKAIEQPGETYTPLKGAVKTIESPTETAESLNRAFPATSTGRRTALARWISDRQNPLTARVAVNHIWGRHFNAPLVPTVFEFGRKGLPPTHPELLDWLAVELMDSGWKTKHIHRLIVTSNTYRLSSSSAGAAANVARDGENRGYWRMNPSRLEAQAVRDALLSLAGELDLTGGGPSLSPVQDEASKRRSLYFVHSHNDHHRFLSMFDDAGVLECYRREQSIVPQQALALANSRQALDAATKIAAKLDAGAKPLDDAEFIRGAFSLVLASLPTPDELSACQEALAAWSRAATGTDAAASQRQARINLVHTLLNHNDFITIR